MEYNGNKIQLNFSYINGLKLSDKNERIYPVKYSGGLIMNKIVGLVITDSNSSTFKSKKPVESHSILGQSVLQWSGSALAEITGEAQSIHCDDIDRVKDLIGNSENFIINWGDQPLILADPFRH